jgi:diaminohydroxyphosphoribosylaminopyrimidine deaminase/5-amino-6-(5-phosphoribosylamino)uracil reductase
MISTELSSPEHAARARALRERGAAIEWVPRHDLNAAMSRLAQIGLTSIVLEGGAALHRSAIEAGVVDAVQVYVTPRMLGQDAVAWVAPGVVALGALHDRRAALLADDVLIEGHVHRTD